MMEKHIIQEVNYTQQLFRGIMKEFIKLHGIFELRVFKLIDGKLELIEDYIDKNLVVNVGKEKLCMLLADDGASNYIDRIIFGTSGTAPALVDTSITNPFPKSTTGYSYPSQTSVKFEWTLGLTENNGVTIREYGLATADSTLFSRKVRSGIDKEADVLLEGSWTIGFV